MAFVVLIPTVAIAQDSVSDGGSPEVVEPVRGKDCDAIWDGALFGVLPGIGVGMVGASVGSCGETVDGCGDYLVIWGIAGAGMGLLIDQLHCAEPKARDGRTDSPRSGIPFDSEFRFTAQPASTTRADAR